MFFFQCQVEKLCTSLAHSLRQGMTYTIPKTEKLYVTNNLIFFVGNMKEWWPKSRLSSIFNDFPCLDPSVTDGLATNHLHHLRSCVTPPALMCYTYYPARFIFTDVGTDVARFTFSNRRDHNPFLIKYIYTK